MAVSPITDTDLVQLQQAWDDKSHNVAILAGRLVATSLGSSAIAASTPDNITAAASVAALAGGAYGVVRSAITAAAAGTSSDLHAGALLFRRPDTGALLQTASATPL